MELSTLLTSLNKTFDSDKILTDAHAFLQSEDYRFVIKSQNILVPKRVELQIILKQVLESKILSNIPYVAVVSLGKCIKEAGFFSSEYGFIKLYYDLNLSITSIKLTSELYE
ncbi:MAG: hypothetical protein KC646_13810 [Candidatus Cloacimonetes bacterium]|nr:hypothetical protein [Candidatus Cloacimonadota bacterium]